MSLAASAKKKLKAVAPPVVLRIARKALGRPEPASKPAIVERPAWEYLPDGWSTSDSRIAGWNVPSIAETQGTKWDSFRESVSGTGPLGVSHEAPAGSGREDTWAHNLIMSYAYVLALAARKKEQLSMLDWGGGIGHYHPLSKAILPDVDLEYHCQDVPMLCDVGRKLLPEGHFFDDARSCFNRTYDFVHAGSSLWCVEDWKTAAADLAAAADDYLYVTRMMFIRSAPSFVAVQRPQAYGYLTEYQLWILNEGEFVAFVQSCGMVLVREFVFGPGPHVHGAPEQGVFRGFLFQRARPPE